MSPCMGDAATWLDVREAEERAEKVEKALALSQERMKELEEEVEMYKHRNRDAAARDRANLARAEKAEARIAELESQIAFLEPWQQRYEEQLNLKLEAHTEIEGLKGRIAVLEKALQKVHHALGTSIEALESEGIRDNPENAVWEKYRLLVVSQGAPDALESLPGRKQRLQDRRLIHGVSARDDFEDATDAQGDAGEK